MTGEIAVRSRHDETLHLHLHLRLPAALRADLDGQAREAGVRLSVVTRNALAVGLVLIRNQSTPDNDGTPPRTPPAAPMQAAA